MWGGPKNSDALARGCNATIPLLPIIAYCSIYYNNPLVAYITQPDMHGTLCTQTNARAFLPHHLHHQHKLLLTYDKITPIMSQTDRQIEYQWVEEPTCVPWLHSADPICVVYRRIFDNWRDEASPNELCVRLKYFMTTGNLSHNWANTNLPMRYVEADLHYGWRLFIEGGKWIKSFDATQDRLVVLLLSLQAKGHLRRPTASVGSTETDDRADDKSNEDDDDDDKGALVLMSDGSRFWTDLPFFAHDLVQEWADHYYGNVRYDRQKRGNLAGFVGRIMSAGIFNGTATCFLSLARETLETRRPLLVKDVKSGSTPAADITITITKVETETETEGDMKTGKEEANIETEHHDTDETILSIEELLGHFYIMVSGCAVATQKLRHRPPIRDGGENNTLASTAYITTDSTQISNLGELAVDAVTISSSGFSPERWDFWLQRLKELASCGVEPLQEHALEIMINFIKHKDGRLRSSLGPLFNWVGDRSMELYPYP